MAALPEPAAGQPDCTAECRAGVAGNRRGIASGRASRDQFETVLAQTPGKTVTLLSPEGRENHQPEVVTKSAKPPFPVQIRAAPPTFALDSGEGCPPQREARRWAASTGYALRLAETQPKAGTAIGLHCAPNCARLRYAASAKQASHGLTCGFRLQAEGQQVAGR